MFDIAEIKKIRKMNNLTQGELAKISGVSQSLIAKIESGRIDPAFSKSVKIFHALETKSLKNEKKIEDIMQKSIVWIDPDAQITDCIRKMKRFAISQMPVMENSVCIGAISEKAILEAMINGNMGIVKDFMEDVPPIVSKSASVRAASSLLKHFQMVIVSDKGKIKGVVTRTDILNNI